MWIVLRTQEVLFKGGRIQNFTNNNNKIYSGLHKTNKFIYI